MPYIGAKELKASDIRRFDVTSSTSATHTLTWTPPTEQSLIVTINGIKQHEDAYSVSGTTLTLSSPLVATDKLEVIGINDIGTTITPAQNSVGLDKLATTGTPSSSTFLRGDMAWTAVSDTSGFSSVQTFTSSGTWTRPSGITKVIMYVTGGGGNGGGSTGDFFYAGSGGGAGGTAIKFLDVSSISSSTITVGAAGGASSWADGTNTITGNGGAIGGNSSATPGTGGTATGGDINLTGGDGEKRISNSGGGQGGSSYWGGTDSHPASGTPSAATTYGTGGSASSGGDAAGGAGAPGIVYVQEYK